MTILQEVFLAAKNTPSDINQHLEVLYNLACECKSVVEFGVRFGNSTKAFLAADVKLRSYDLNLNSSVYNLFNIAKSQGKDVEYIAANDLLIQIENTDLLFIDTDHSYDQLVKELDIHHQKVNKYIAFHDTYTCGLWWQPNCGSCESDTKGLLSAIIEFMISHPEWKFKYYSTENNGLTVIEKV